MAVKFVNYPADYKRFKKEYDAAYQRVMESGDLILRKDVEEFEEKLANYVGTKFAVALNSGTDAIYLALKACGIDKGDEVITSSHTFKSTVGAIINSNAKPIIVDIRSDGLIDMKQVKEKITPKTKAIIPVHIAGAMCDMNKLYEIIGDREIFVIEDQAQAFGTKL